MFLINRTNVKKSQNLFLQFEITHNLFENKVTFKLNCNCQLNKFSTEISDMFENIDKANYTYTECDSESI